MMTFAYDYVWLYSWLLSIDNLHKGEALPPSTCLRKTTPPTSCFDVGCSAKTYLEDEFTFCDMNTEENQNPFSSPLMLSDYMAQG